MKADFAFLQVAKKCTSAEADNKNLLTAVINSKLECSSLSATSTLVSYLWAGLEPTRLELLKGLQSSGRLLAFPKNTRQCCKWLIKTNTLAYWDARLVTIVKIVIVQAPDNFDTKEENVNMKIRLQIFLLS